MYINDTELISAGLHRIIWLRQILHVIMIEVRPNYGWLPLYLSAYHSCLGSGCCR